MQYDWIDFYTEFATKLLPFKADRKALIQKIYAVYSMVGMSVPKLESGDEVIDIDPFTIFGTFNKGITNANRVAILEGIASVFRISATVPSNFDGIPVLNNLKATFYGFIIRSSAWKQGHQLGLKIAVDLFLVGRTDKVEAMEILRKI